MPLNQKMTQLIAGLQAIEHGFKHIIAAGDELLADATADHLEEASALLDEPAYQARMLGTYLLGQLAAVHQDALQILRDRVAKDPDWRVQEMLAKAVDAYCSTIGYEKALPFIRKWLSHQNPNIPRAVIEGLRIWTGRSYFNAHPGVAIQLISAHRGSSSDYLRKSVANALRDIRKKHKDLVDAEIATWNSSDVHTAHTLKIFKR